MTSRSHLRFLTRLGVAAATVAGAITVVALAGGGESPVRADATEVMARYDMNEPAGSTTLIDSSGNGHHGSSGPNNIKNGSTHRYLDRSPTALPAEPQRLDTVPHSADLNPGSADFAVTVRYRTSKPFGNLIQKGQNTTIGGYFKIELPAGLPSCLFIGEENGIRYNAGVNTPAGHAINDNQWHTVRCEKHATYVAVVIDGVELARTAKPAKTIANDKVISIAGKSSCDQITVTCDYFVGEIDWVLLETGDAVAQNDPPHAAFSRSCNSAGMCTFNASASDDSDGEIVSWDWDFGDGTTGSGEVVAHPYAASGNYRVTLVVTDDEGATDDKAQQQSVTVPTTTSSTSTTTTTTIVGQLPPGFLDDVGDAATVDEPAKRVGNPVVDPGTTTTSNPDDD